MTKDHVYQLQWDLQGVAEGEYIADLIEFPGHENIVGWSLTRDIPVPNPVLFEADFSRLEDTDYPNNNAQWPLMSHTMLDALSSAGEFPHRMIPVTMIDDTVLGESDRFDEAGVPRPEAANTDYVAVQLLEHSDFFDWDRSAYERVEDFPDEVDMITRLVLEEPSGGFPPLFRLTVSPVYLFVSARGREAMERSGVRGAVYGSLDRFPVG